MEKRAKGFIPDAEEKLRALLLGYKEKAQKRLDVLSGNDRENLIEQRSVIEGQINNVKPILLWCLANCPQNLSQRKRRGSGASVGK